MLESLSWQPCALCSLGCRLSGGEAAESIPSVQPVALLLVPELQSQQCHRESRQGTCMGSRWRWPVATRAPSVGQEMDRAGLLLLQGGVTDFKAVPWRLGGCHEPGGCWCELLRQDGALWGEAAGKISGRCSGVTQERLWRALCAGQLPALQRKAKPCDFTRSFQAWKPSARFVSSTWKARRWQRSRSVMPFDIFE